MTPDYYILGCVMIFGALWYAYCAACVAAMRRAERDHERRVKYQHAHTFPGWFWERIGVDRADRDGLRVGEASRQAKCCED